jgi:DNA-binding NarL/FixJ family response regulator
MSTLRLRIAIADDSYLVREALGQLLAEVPDVEVVAVCEDTYALQKAIDCDPPDVVLTDIRMPPSRGNEGIRVAAEVRATRPDIGVVILSQSPIRHSRSSCSRRGPKAGHTCSRRASGTVAS